MVFFSEVQVMTPITKHISIELGCKQHLNDLNLSYGQTQNNLQIKSYKQTAHHVIALPNVI
jgi:hypothetical protein